MPYRSALFRVVRVFRGKLFYVSYVFSVVSFSFRVFRVFRGPAFQSTFNRYEYRFIISWSEERDRSSE